MDNDIINWILLDDKLKKYNEKCKELKLLRGEYNDKILDNLSDKNEVFIIESKNIQIYVAKINSYSTFNDKFLLDSFKEYFMDDTKSIELLKFLKDRRNIEEKHIIKTRAIN